MEKTTNLSNEWHRDRVPMAKYNNTISLIKSRIASLMRENDDIIRLIKYTTPNALDESNPVTNKIKKELFVQGTENTRVFLSAFNPEVVKEEGVEIHLSMPIILTEDHGLTEVPKVEIDVIVAYGVDAIDDGMSTRHDLLMQEIHDTIVGYSVGAIGYIEPLKKTEVTLKNNTHSVWAATYKVGEIKV